MLTRDSDFSLKAGTGVFICALLTGACALLPTGAAFALAAVGIAVPLLCVVWTRPEVAIVGLVTLTAGLVRVQDLYLPLPLGGLYVQDLVLLGLFGLLAVRALVNDGVRGTWWAVTRPLLVFLSLGVGSVVYGVALRDVELTRALNELRPVFYYATAIATAMSLTRTTHRTLLLVGLFALADVITTALIVQQFAGAGSFVFPGMAEWQVNDVGVESQSQAGGFGLMRIVPPAHLLLFVMSILAFVFALMSGAPTWVRVLCAGQCAYLNLGLLLTYTRAQWIASVLALVILSAFLPRSYRQRIVRGLAALLGVCLLTLVASQAGLPLPGADYRAVVALTERATSVLSPGDTLGSSSLQWRVFETEEALRSLRESPQGVGLGNAYRAITTYAGEAAGYQGEPLNRFMHNSYLYIAVKMGVLGLAAFLWLCWAFLSNGWRLFRGLPEGPERWIALALLACFAAAMQWSFTEPNFMQPGGTMFIGVMVGIAASISHQRRAAAEAE